MPGTVQSVERAAAVLRLLAAEMEPLALAQVSGALGLAKGTAHGLLRTLMAVGFVTQDHDSGLYRLSADLLQLGSCTVDVNDLRSRALNWADALAARTGEATRIAVFRETRVLVAHHVFRRDRTSQALQTGAELPLHATALGKVLLAFDPGAARSIVGARLDSLTYRTITDRSHLVRELADVRERGWAAAVEESEPGEVDIAAPVRDKGGYVIAAVGVTGRVDRLCDERARPRGEVVARVLDAGRAISREFGHGAEP